MKTFKKVMKIIGAIITFAMAAFGIVGTIITIVDSWREKQKEKSKKEIDTMNDVDEIMCEVDEAIEEDVETEEVDCTSEE